MAFLSSLIGGSSLLSGLLGAAGNAADAGAMQSINQADENFQLGLYAEQVHHQEQMSIQSTMFDNMMDERSENIFRKIIIYKAECHTGGTVLC